MRVIGIWSFVLIVSLIHSPASGQTDSLVRTLSGETVGNWRLSGDARYYSGADLYKFIDGGADVFLEYGFRRAAALEYENRGGNTILLEVYEMEDAPAAQAVYAHQAGSGGRTMGVGNEGRRFGYYAMFWKGSFFVCLSGSDSSADCGTGIESIARKVSENVREVGRKAALLDFLPQSGLTSERYVRGMLGLSSVYDFRVSGSFGMKECAVGTYSDHVIFLLRYEGQDPVQGALARIQNTLAQQGGFAVVEKSQSSVVLRDKDSMSIRFQISGRYVIGALADNPIISSEACDKVVSRVR